MLRTNTRSLTEIPFTVPDFNTPLTPVLFTLELVGTVPAELESWSCNHFLKNLNSDFTGTEVRGPGVNSGGQ